MKPQEPADELSAINALSQTIPLEEPSPRLRTKSTLTGSDCGSSGSGSTRFQIKKVLGSGSFGTVSLAWDVTLKREVAIKRPADTANYGAKQTFLHEAQLAARIKHPGVVVVHDFGLDETGDPFVVYEYLPGQNLRDRMAAGSFDVRQVLQLGIAIAEALVAVHKVGLTHRDLKPANILLDADDRPHIADFGLAVCDETQLERYGEVAGTYRYMAPEQVRGEANLVDGRTDLWALGVIIYQLLTGHYPFPGDSKLQIFEQVLEREPRPLRQWNAEIPKRLEEIILHLLCKPIDSRYASATDLVIDLRACLESLGVPPEPPASARISPAGLAGALGGVVVLIALIGGYLIYPHLGTSAPKPDTNALPAAQLESAYPAGVWTSVLKEEPQVLIRNGDDQVRFVEGQVEVDAEYQVILQLGSIVAPNYSYRVTVEPDHWNAKAGLFVGWQPVPGRADQDLVTLLGVKQLRDEQSILPRTMLFQTGGTQLPIGSEQLMGVSRLPLIPGKTTADIQLEVVDGQISRLFLNSQQLKITENKVREAPTQGIFGVYVLGGKCKFTQAEFRITKRVQP